jgi:hypothetical protein
MGHEADIAAAHGISHTGVLPELATNAASRRWSHHFRRPVEGPFTAQERDHVTILFGGLTWKHERFIQAAFQACGYRFQALPNPTLTSYHLGRSFGNPGQCNPAYFTVGNLVQYLRELETRGLSKQEIIDNYVFFTAGSCGPCRFGMYESEYRMALENAGFDGFRVLLFSQNDGIKAQSGEPGLKFSVDLGMGAMNALNLGDITNDIAYQLRPYEVVPGVHVGEQSRISKTGRVRQAAYRPDESPFRTAGRHSAPPQFVGLCPAIQRLSGESRYLVRQHRVFRLHDERDVPRGVESRLN